jgi:arsenical pump membrane protein
VRGWNVAPAGVPVAAGVRGRGGAVAPGDLPALLLGTNIGPLVTPWASVATVLWAGRCRAAGVPIRWGRFVAGGAVTATLALAAAVAALTLV